MKKLLATLLLLSSSAAWGQSTPARQNVIFHCNCDEQVGSLIATAFRDDLARSPRYREVVEDKDSKESSLRFFVLTMDDIPESHDHVAYSAVLLFGDAFITHEVGICGRTRAEGCAKDLLAFVDHAWN